jgi:hypothetical protein
LAGKGKGQCEGFGSAVLLDLYKSVRFLDLLVSSTYQHSSHLLW